MNEPNAILQLIALLFFFGGILTIVRCLFGVGISVFVILQARTNLGTGIFALVWCVVLILIAGVFVKVSGTYLGILH